MNQSELAKRHAIRKSMPEQHTCCHATHRYLYSTFEDGEWRWRVHIVLPFITHCPWCGEKLPDRGRLKIEEARHEG